MLTLASVEPGAAAPADKSSYIVTVKSGTDPTAAAKKHGATPTRIYREAVTGYAALLSPGQLKKATADPSTLSVELDAIRKAIDPAAPKIKDDDFPNPPQEVQSEIERVGGLASPTANIDGVDERIDADVAVIDTGVDLHHPDLNVAGVKSCVQRSGSVLDRHGHGTMVAGQISAIDNDIGIVGIAPGARIWGVQVAAGVDGGFQTSAILCALDWVAAHSEVIDVVNMSYGTLPKSVSTCPDPVKSSKKNARPDAEHQALCTLDQQGVVLVASAGNDSSGEPHTPSGYEEVINVSAIGDSDGQPGELGEPITCPLVFAEDNQLDDHFAFFSNFGPTVDISAPGVCNVSTYPGRLYSWSTGTSFAAPLVAGAAALYLDQHPSATPAQVRGAILGAAEPGPIPGDPDNFPEGVLDVSSF
jgi:subtilisin family serine protease